MAPPHPVASVADADDLDNVIPGTERYARSLASQSQEKMNVSRARRDRGRRADSSSPTSELSDSDPDAHIDIGRRESSRRSPKEKERRMSSRPHVFSSRPRSGRPSSMMAEHAALHPADEAVYYGVSPHPPSAPPHSRPRSTSYFDSPPPSRPPPANARFYNQQASLMPYSTPAYPPTPTWAPGPVGYPPAPVSAVANMPPNYSSSTAGLAARFNRPQSVMGFRAPPSLTYDDYDPEQDSKMLSRGMSLSRKHRDEDDRKRMPPPSRPQTTRPPAQAFRPPPSSRRKSVAFHDDDAIDDVADFVAPSPYDHPPEPESPKRRHRRTTLADTTRTNDLGHYRTEIASTTRRRSSQHYYGDRSISSGSGLEDKLRQAHSYQSEIQGGHTLPLTEAALRGAGQHVASSRSTHSTESQDTSGYKEPTSSRTARTSAMSDDDVTIRVIGTTTLKVGGAEMQCQDGAEINIISRGGSGFRGESDKSSFVDVEERRARIGNGENLRSRLERLPMRPRSSSHARSYSQHTLPMPAPRYGSSYDHPSPSHHHPLYPPYSVSPEEGYYR